MGVNFSVHRYFLCTNERLPNRIDQLVIISEGKNGNCTQIDENAKRYHYPSQGAGQKHHFHVSCFIAFLNIHFRYTLIGV